MHYADDTVKTWIPYMVPYYHTLDNLPDRSGSNNCPDPDTPISRTENYRQKDNTRNNQLKMLNIKC